MSLHGRSPRSREPWTTLFWLAAVGGGHESELLALWWENLNLSNPARATITFTHQVDRRGNRFPLKTDESKATLPLPRAIALMLLEQKRRSFAQRPSLVRVRHQIRPAARAAECAPRRRPRSEAARNADGQPRFPRCSSGDERGVLVVDGNGALAPRRDLPTLPGFHALRHTAAMDCGDAEEARDLLRHRNSNVTRAIYRAHFEDKRRELLRARMEARMEAAGRS